MKSTVQVKGVHFSKKSPFSTVKIKLLKILHGGPSPGVLKLVAQVNDIIADTRILMKHPCLIVLNLFKGSLDIKADNSAI